MIDFLYENRHNLLYKFTSKIVLSFKLQKHKNTDTHTHGKVENMPTYAMETHTHAYNTRIVAIWSSSTEHTHTRTYARTPLRQRCATGRVGRGRELVQMNYLLPSSPFAWAGFAPEKYGARTTPAPAKGGTTHPYTHTHTRGRTCARTQFCESNL